MFIICFAVTFYMLQAKTEIQIVLLLIFINKRP